MTNRIDPSRWTGPFESGRTDRGPGTYTHQAGQHGFASDYQRFYEIERAKALVPPELRPVILLSVWVLFSPALLWLAWFVVHASTRDLVVQDNAHVLMLWGSGAVGLGLWQLASRSVALIPMRKALLALALGATIVVAALYGYIGVKAHAQARSSAPERAFVTGSKDRVNFQGPDGSLLFGGRQSEPQPHGNCVSVVMLTGDYGFTWARVVEWVPRQRHQLFWPVRREDCFSDQPLASFAS